MNCISVVSLLVIAAVAMASANNSKPQYELSEANTLFEKFIKDHNRQYKDDADKEAHFRAFVSSLETINRLNKDDTGATHDINKFADYTPEERKSMFGLKIKEQ